MSQLPSAEPGSIRGRIWQRGPLGRISQLAWRILDLRNATKAVAAGLLLAVVPTVFAVLPETTRWSLWIRVPVMVAWAIVGLAVVATSTGRDSVIDELVNRRRRERRQSDKQAAAAVLESLLSKEGHGLPPKYAWTVYLHDSETDYLLPVFPEPTTDTSDVRAFLPGHGAVGRAFESQPDAVVLVTGDAVSSGEYGLRPDQQRAFKAFRTVVAIPVLSEEGRIFGALTGIAPSTDRHFATTSGAAALRNLAQVVGVVLTRIHLDSDPG